MFWIEAEAKTTSSIGDLDYTGESVHVRLSSVCGISQIMFYSHLGKNLPFALNRKVEKMMLRSLTSRR